MKQVTTFEGYYDQDPGWEFDMPIYMLNPIMGYFEDGSGVGGIENLIEEYFINKFMEQDKNGKAIGKDEDYYYEVPKDLIRSVKLQFAHANKNKAREGIIYWRKIIEWDDEDMDYEKRLEEIETGKY